MRTHEIRTKFLDFFQAKGHTIVASDSLVPKDDPTVLFTTAGMQQFKKQFLGHIDNYTKAATSQKCLRTDDLNEVGVTDFHHTFFEMLGNFSFGDYFKKEAIAYAWEFLTKELNVPVEKLWISVYKEDAEALDIWINAIGINPKKLVKLSDHSNFWPADAKEKGPNGPCGPCSEIFYDYGKNPNCKNKKCDPDCNCGRFSEIWNLVFTQYERKEGGILDPLPNKNIDTGMGLERLACVLQGKRNNFEIDIFQPILCSLESLLKDKKALSLKNKRIIADHMRAIVFGISDGVVPSNEGRGYVIKKLIIDITDKIIQSGESVPFIFKLVPSVIEAMQEPYPEIIDKRKSISDIIKNMEKNYFKVRKERLPALKKDMTNILNHSDNLDNKSEEMGSLFFKYRDTYGLTLSSIIDASKDMNLRNNIKEKAIVHFNTLMEKQKQKSRESSKMTGDVFANNELELAAPKTEFTGFKHSSSTCTILQIFVNNQSINKVNKSDKIKIVLDKTPFYPESGGQIGDKGHIFF